MERIKERLRVRQMANGGGLAQAASGRAGSSLEFGGSPDSGHCCRNQEELGQEVTGGGAVWPQGGELGLHWA